MSKIKVLFVAAELTPLAKVGGLADVIGALPKALNTLGVDVRIVIPKYGIVDEKKYRLKKIAEKVVVPFTGKKEEVIIWKTLLPDSAVPVYLIDHLGCLGKDGVYLEKDASSLGNLEECRRFTFFVRAVLEIFPVLKWWPEIVHCHDWHVGILPTLLRILGKTDHRYHQQNILLTIHNLAYQGKYLPQDVLSSLDLKGDEWPTLEERFGPNKDINYLQQAILNSDYINTVSPGYALEILTPEYGEELDKTLEKRKEVLSGILNGIDIDRFNPKSDPEIKTQYSLETIHKKIENKIDLQKSIGLPEDKQLPVFGLVSRLTDQKGIELICQLVDELAALDAQFVFLGVGQRIYEEGLKKAAQKYPKIFSVHLKFDAHLAQQIYAGSDIFLMPSRFEPCGLGQMIAMRYGTIPIVRATGGLKDTVQNYNPRTNTGSGFVFINYTSGELLAIIKKTLEIFHNKATWQKIIKHAMQQDFSWTRSAQMYLDLYHKAIKK